MIRRKILKFAAALALLSPAAGLPAPTYPTRPIRFTAPHPPAGRPRTPARRTPTATNDRPTTDASATKPASDKPGFGGTGLSGAHLTR